MRSTHNQWVIINILRVLVGLKGNFDQISLRRHRRSIEVLSSLIKRPILLQQTIESTKLYVGRPKPSLWQVDQILTDTGLSTNGSSNPHQC